MRKDKLTVKRLPPRAAFLAAALVLLFVSLPKGADATVFTDEQQLGQVWDADVAPLFQEINQIFTNSAEVTPAEIDSAYGLGPGDGPMLKQLYSPGAGPARLYTGLLKHADNADLLKGYIFSPSKKANVTELVTLCRSMGKIANDLTNRLVPLQKQHLILQFKADPAKDFTPSEIGGVLLDNALFLDVHGLEPYNTTPLILNVDMISQPYWTSDSTGFRHPCVQAWMNAVIATRPDGPEWSVGTYDYWNDPADTLQFKNIQLPQAVCDTRPGVSAANCHPRAERFEYEMPESAIVLSNISEVQTRLDGVIKAMEDKIKALEAPALAAEAARKAEAERLAALRAATLGRGSVLTLPLPLSDITVPQLIGRILNALLGIVGAIALLMFVWGGLSWMTAAGDAAKVGKAKQIITWAALGLIAIFSSYAVLNLVIQTFS